MLAGSIILCHPRSPSIRRQEGPAIEMSDWLVDLAGALIRVPFFLGHLVELRFQCEVCPSTLALLLPQLGLKLVYSRMWR